MRIKKSYNRITIHFRENLCVAAVHKMIQEKVSKNSRNHKNQYHLFHKTGFLFFILFSLFFMIPPTAWAGEIREMASHVKIVPNIVLCRTVTDRPNGATPDRLNGATWRV